MANKKNINNENNQYFNTVPDDELNEFEQNLENEKFEDTSYENQNEDQNQSIDEIAEKPIEEKPKPKKKTTKKINIKKKKITKKKKESTEELIENKQVIEKEIDSDYLNTVIARKATERLDVPILHHID